MTLLEMGIFILAGMAIEANFGVAKKMIELAKKTQEGKKEPEKPKL